MFLPHEQFLQQGTHANRGPAGVDYGCQETEHARDEEFHLRCGMPEYAESDGLFP